MRNHRQTSRSLMVALSLGALFLAAAGAAENGGEHPATPATPTATPTTPAKDAPETPISQADIDALTYDDCAEDNDFVTPFAHNYRMITSSNERRDDWDHFKDKLEAWEPGKVPDLTQRVRNLVSVAALMDLGEGPFEAEAPLLVYKKLEQEVPKDKLIAALAQIVFHPDRGTVIETLPDFDLGVAVGQERVRERVAIYAKKMLGRLKGKLSVE